MSARDECRQIAHLILIETATEIILVTQIRFHRAEPIFAMHNVLVRAPRAFATQVLPTGTESASGHFRRFQPRLSAG
jgi:hypothetical protein